MTETGYDIVIIGGGMAGAATAYCLSRKGDKKILLLERESTYGVHASGRNAALLRQGVENPGIATFIQETVKVLTNPPSDWPQPNVFQKTGSLLLGEEKKIRELESLLISLGSSAQTYSPREFPEGLPEKLQSALLEAEYEALLHTPGDGVVDVHGLMGNYLAGMIGRGGEVRFNSEVKEINFKGDHCLVSGKGFQIETRALVNAAGAWAPNLGKEAGVRVGEMLPLRRHLFISEPDPEVQAPWPFLWDIHHEYYFRPESGGLLLCAGDEEPHPPSPPLTDPRIAELLAEKLHLHFPSFAKVSIRRSWACLRTKRRDGQFHIGSEPEYPGYFWVAALGGHGVSASMGVGEFATRQIIDNWES